jgi:poly-gamma-glutamate synthase PgsB/CapB
MLYIIILLLILSFLIAEKILHEWRIKRIPIRIHINGTRGKSSVSRLIASALRETGIRTLAKTTGTIPTLIYPDGHEEIISRRGPSRIQEQMEFVKKAVKMNVKAIVVECMAIDPHLQYVSENRMIESTIGVITNVRRDHFETMGKDLDGIAESLSQTIPRNGVLVTTDSHYFSYFSSLAAPKNTKAYLVEDTELDSAQEPKQRLIFRENLSIAKKVYSHLGITPSSDHLLGRGFEKELSGIIKIKNGGKTIYFIDAFSANDIDSTKIIQQMTLDEQYCPKPYVALLNNRSDRPLRMLSFASFLSRGSIYDYIMLIGDLKQMAKRHIHREGKKDNVFILKNQEPKKLIEDISQRIPSLEFTIIGMGNYKGIGGELPHFLQIEGEK